MVHQGLGGGGIPLEIGIQNIPVDGHGQGSAHQGHYGGNEYRRKTSFLPHMLPPFRGENV